MKRSDEEQGSAGIAALPSSKSHNPTNHGLDNKKVNRMRYNRVFSYSLDMKVLKQQFMVVVEQDEDGVYIGRVPEMQGCHTYGKTLDELKSNMDEVVDLWVRNTKNVPTPMKFHSIQLMDFPVPAHA